MILDGNTNDLIYTIHFWFNEFLFKKMNRTNKTFISNRLKCKMIMNMKTSKKRHFAQKKEKEQGNKYNVRAHWSEWQNR